MKIIIPGKPIAQQRHRDGKHGNKYDPQSELKKPIRLFIKRQVRQKPLEGAVAIVMRFYMPIPKGTSEKQAKLMEMGEIHHTKKPDLDNMEKFYCDVLKGIAWIDDSQVVHSDCKKMYSQNPHTEIWVMEV